MVSTILQLMGNTANSQTVCATALTIVSTELLWYKEINELWNFEICWVIKKLV